ncbi:MAG: hypothetical protein ABSF69_21170 [Polyangiaceae bacterium]
MVRVVRGRPLGSAIAVIDSSSGRSDGWSYAIAAYVDEGLQRRRLCLSELGPSMGSSQTPFPSMASARTGC